MEVWKKSKGKGKGQRMREQEEQMNMGENRRADENETVLSCMSEVL